MIFFLAWAIQYDLDFSIYAEKILSIYVEKLLIYYKIYKEISHLHLRRKLFFFFIWQYQHRWWFLFYMFFNIGSIVFLFIFFSSTMFTYYSSFILLYLGSVNDWKWFLIFYNLIWLHTLWNNYLFILNFLMCLALKS